VSSGVGNWVDFCPDGQQLGPTRQPHQELLLRAVHRGQLDAGEASAEDVCRVLGYHLKGSRTPPSCRPPPSRRPSLVALTEKSSPTSPLPWPPWELAVGTESGRVSFD
jgi:hypothetical protein